MNSALKFFLNALKAIFLSPFYLLVFVLTLLYAIINYIVGIFRWIFSGFTYGSRKTNKYLIELEKVAKEGANQWLP